MAWSFGDRILKHLHLKPDLRKQTLVCCGWYCYRQLPGEAFICFYPLEGRQTLRLFLPSNSPPFARAFPVTKRCSGRDFPTKVTPSTPWGGCQTGFAGRQTASPYGSPGRPFHYACRLMLDRLLILATIVASAFDLPVKSAFDGDLRGLPCVEAGADCKSRASRCQPERRGCSLRPQGDFLENKGLTYLFI